MKPRGISTVASFFILFTFMLYQTGRLLEPFLAPIVGAAFVAILFYPLHLKFGKWLHFKNPDLHALVSDGVVTLICLGPALLLVAALLMDVSHVVPLLRENSDKMRTFMNAPSAGQLPLLNHLPEKWQVALTGRSAQIHEKLISSTRELLERSAGGVRKFAENMVSALTHLGILLFCLYFFFRDGPQFVDRLYRLFPMPQGTREQLDGRIVSTVVSVVRGSLLTGLAQGTAITIGLMILRLQGAVLCGFLAIFCSFVPVVGNAIVWAPIVIFLFVTGAVWKAVFLLAWGVIVLGALEQILRPFLMGGAEELPMFWLTLSMLGGMDVFGARGMLLGPVIGGAMAVLLKIYETHFLGDIPERR